MDTLYTYVYTYTCTYERAVQWIVISFALHTKLWLTGCYRSHLRPLTVCKILDICVYIKEGSEGRGRCRKWCVSHLCVSSTGGVDEDRREGSGRHLIKTVAAHLRYSGFGSRRGLRLGKWSGWVWAWMEVCVYVCVWEFVLYHRWVERMCVGFSVCRYFLFFLCIGHFSCEPAFWLSHTHTKEKQSCSSRITVTRNEIQKLRGVFRAMLWSCGGQSDWRFSSVYQSDMTSQGQKMI